MNAALGGLKLKGSNPDSYTQLQLCLFFSWCMIGSRFALGFFFLVMRRRSWYRTFFKCARNNMTLMFKGRTVHRYDTNINKCLKRLIQTDTQCLGTLLPNRHIVLCSFVPFTFHKTSACLLRLKSL